MLVIASAAAITAYALFYLYDWFNVLHPHVKAANLLFPFSCLLVLVATVLAVIMGLPCFSLNAFTVVCLILCALCGVAMINALFFSLPKGTYVDPGGRRIAYREKMYALCRHPGVLWYVLFYVFLLMTMLSFSSGVVFALLIIGNLLYMLLQDFWTFPQIFVDYGDYKKGTPLFFPNASSIRRWIEQTQRGQNVS